LADRRLVEFGVPEVDLFDVPGVDTVGELHVPRETADESVRPWDPLGLDDVEELVVGPGRGGAIGAAPVERVPGSAGKLTIERAVPWTSERSVMPAAVELNETPPVGSAAPLPIGPAFDEELAPAPASS
jgi:hypothetical protein